MITFRLDVKANIYISFFDFNNGPYTCLSICLMYIYIHIFI